MLVQDRKIGNWTRDRAHTRVHVSHFLFKQLDVVSVKREPEKPQLGCGKVIETIIFSDRILMLCWNAHFEKNG